MRTISALSTILFSCLVCLAAAAEDLNITPTNGLSVCGLPGGPFSGTTNLVLTNTGAASLSWSLANTANWLSASPSSGSLDPGGPATTITVSLTPAANNLPFGNYSANIWFTNINDSVAQSVPFGLAVNLVQNGGFETGDFTDWTLTGTNASTYNFVSDVPNGYFSTHTGTYLAMLGEYKILAHLTQTIPTIPGQMYQISFWFNTDNQSPNEFLFNWNGQTLFHQTNIDNFPGYVWTNFQFTAIATNTNTVIEFAAQNDSSYFGLDDVSVQPFVVPPLAFQSITKTGSSLQLTWNSISGVVYQLQYRTNLAGPNWVNVGSLITASTSTVSIPAPIISDPAGFYRVQQLP